MDTFELRLSTLIGGLECSQPCTSQQDACRLVKSEWLSVCSEIGMPPEYLQLISEWQPLLEAEVDSASAVNFRLNGKDEPQVCTFIQADGGIVIQRFEGESVMQILLNLPPNLNSVVHLHG